MLRETERLCDAIDALCGKRKAKLLKKLARKAIEAERSNTQVPWTLTGDVAHIPSPFGYVGTTIATDGTVANPYVAGITTT